MIFKLLVLPFVLSTLVCTTAMYLLLRKRGLPRLTFWLSVVSLGFGLGFIFFIGIYLVFSKQYFRQIN
ncbi:hypothetical protein [Pedobacter yulinensis]|uniref:hypothetical protein n=1 Tax=Pedobacter yulinensis TaxID=2126353 RepID=UPI0013A67EE2|nr:hypothetical protein [Pedobacter yulinensis]